MTLRTLKPRKKGSIYIYIKEVVLNIFIVTIYVAYLPFGGRECDKKHDKLAHEISMKEDRDGTHYILYVSITV